MFQHKGTGEWITGYKDVSPRLLTSGNLVPAPESATPEDKPGTIIFTFSSLQQPKPLPPPPPQPVARTVLSPLKLPFLNSYDEAMCRLFRKNPTALDMVVRTLFAKYECNYVTLAHIAHVMGEYGMVLHTPLHLVASQTGPCAVEHSWGFYFPYFDAVQDDKSKVWYFGLTLLFHQVVQ